MGIEEYHHTEFDRWGKEKISLEHMREIEDDPEKRRELDKLIIRADEMLEMHGEFLDDLKFMRENRGNDQEIELKIRNDRRNTERVLGRIEVKDDDFEEMSHVKNENRISIEKTNEMSEDFWETYKKDSKLNLGLAITGIVGSLLFGLAGLGIAIASLYYTLNPAKKAVHSNSGGGGGDNSDLPGPSHLGLNRLAGDEKEMTADEIADMMQRLVTSKAVVAAGKVSQELFWPNLAANANQMRIEDQNLTLIFVQQASVDLPGTSEFFWLDPSEQKQQYEALRAAYHKSNKFSDVYLAAAKIRYDDKEVPMFHVASLI